MTTKLSPEGRLTIPREVRDRHGWGPGTALDISDRGAFVVIQSPVELPITELEDLRGCANYDGPRRSLMDMEEAIARGAREQR